MKRLWYACGAFLASAPVLLAQQASENDIDVSKINDALDKWTKAATDNMDNWIDKLLPLFGAGILLVLAFIAWRLFKRTARSST